MAADAALISSFEKLATAGVRDYSGQLKLQKEQGKIITKGITKTADIIAKGIQDKKKAEQDKQAAEEKAYKAQNEKDRLETSKNTTEFSKNMQKVGKNLEEDGGLEKEYADLVWNWTEELKGDFDDHNIQGDNTVESKKARAEVMTGVTKMENKIVDVRAFIQTVGDDVGDEKGASNISPVMNKEEQNIVAKCTGAMGSLAENGVVMEKIDGEIYYHITTPEYTSQFLGNTYVEEGVTIPESTETISFEELKEMYTSKNIEGETAIIASGNEAYEKAEKLKVVILIFRQKQMI